MSCFKLPTAMVVTMHSLSVDTRVLLIGCGILQKEVSFLIKKNNWPVSTVFLPSGLHTDFGRLQSTLQRSLDCHMGVPRIVFYGACHPLMDKILSEAGTIRTTGQNCVDMYLGQEAFHRELEGGAFFLFEDWALHWDSIVGGSQGLAPLVMRDIFKDAHSHLLAIRTPCSGDFTAQAEYISTCTSLELHWVDIGLEHLEQVLKATLDIVMKDLA